MASELERKKAMVGYYDGLYIGWIFFGGLTILAIIIAFLSYLLMVKWKEVNLIVKVVITILFLSFGLIYVFSFVFLGLSTINLYYKLDWRDSTLWFVFSTTYTGVVIMIYWLWSRKRKRRRSQ